jgi:hypothetical protein
MECLTCRDNLTAYLDEELTPQEQNLVDQHLRQCAICSAEFSSLSRSYRLVNQTLRDIEVRPEMWTAVEAAIRPRAALTGSWRDSFVSLFQAPSRALAGASVVLILAAGFAVLFQFYQRYSNPGLETYRPQLRTMIEKMDIEERQPHNYLVLPPEDESLSNPFAVQHVSFGRNPFRPGPISREVWEGNGSGNRSLKADEPEVRDTK